MISESLTPFFAAVVAALIRKLCPLKCDASVPEAVSALCSACTKWGRERHEPSWKIKSGPGVGGLMTMYARMAATCRA